MAPDLLYLSVTVSLIINILSLIIIMIVISLSLSSLYSLFLISLGLPNYCFKKSNYTRETLVCEYVLFRNAYLERIISIFICRETAEEMANVFKTFYPEERMSIVLGNILN